jgi:hypothetical protein
MKNYQKGGMPQGINKSAVMPGQASIKTPPMATLKEQRDSLKLWNE